MATENFGRHAVALDSPAGVIVPVTKDDNNDLPDGVCRALLVGTPGTCNLIDKSEATRTAVPLQAGFNPLRVTRVKTGGTADDIWALY